MQAFVRGAFVAERNDSGNILIRNRACKSDRLPVERADLDDLASLIAEMIALRGSK